MLNMCGLTGPVPSELGNLGSLERGFFLYGNTLTGELPSDLGRLYSLQESFSIFGNELCGDVPPPVLALQAHVLQGWDIESGNAFGTPCDNVTWNKRGEPTEDPCAATGAAGSNCTSSKGGAGDAASEAAVITAAFFCGFALFLVVVAARLYWKTTRAYKLSKFPRVGSKGKDIFTMSGGASSSGGDGSSALEIGTVDSRNPQGLECTNAGSLQRVERTLGRSPGPDPPFSPALHSFVRQTSKAQTSRVAKQLLHQAQVAGRSQGHRLRHGRQEKRELQGLWHEWPVVVAWVFACGSPGRPSSDAILQSPGIPAKWPHLPSATGAFFALIIHEL